MTYRKIYVKQYSKLNIYSKLNLPNIVHCTHYPKLNYQDVLIFLHIKKNLPIISGKMLISKYLAQRVRNSKKIFLLFI